MSNTSSTKGESMNKKSLVQRLDEFTHLFEAEINQNVKKELTFNAKSDLATFITSMMVELLSDGFVMPQSGSATSASESKFGFWSIISRGMQADTLSFINQSCIFLQNAQEKACGWLLLELSSKSIASTFQAIALNQNIMSCYQTDAVFKNLQSPILALLNRLDSLNYSIDSEVIRSFRNHIVERRKLVNDSAVSKVCQNNACKGEQDFNNTSEVCKKDGDCPSKANFSRPKALNIQIPEEKENIHWLRDRKNALTASDESPILVPKYPNFAWTKQQEMAQEIGKPPEVQPILSRTPSAPTKTTEKTSLNHRLAYSTSKNPTPFQPESKENQEPSQRAFDKKPSFKRVKPSERLYQEKFKIEEELYVYRSRPSENPDPSKQNYRCYFCNAALSRFTLFLNRSYGYCDYTGHYYCNQCMSTEKMIIPWRVMKDFNFKRFTVSKEAQEELTKYMDKCNITIHPEDDIVQQNKLMTETLYKKQELHLIFDTICEPSRVFDMIQNHQNLVLKQFLFSLKDLQQINDGSMLKLIERIIGLLKKHINSCMECQKKGRVCKLCTSTEKIFAFEVETTSFCKKCRLLYHSKCLRSMGCINCVYKI